MNSLNKILNAVRITSTIIFITSFILKYMDLLTAGEICAIVIVGVYSTLYTPEEI
jgi:hypothetical protein